MKTQLKDVKSQKKFFSQVFLIIYWLIFLQNSDSYYMPYLIVGIFGILSCYTNMRNRKILKKNTDTCILFGGAAFFSILVVSANYKILFKTDFPDIAGRMFMTLYRWINVGAIFIGGFLAFGNLLYYLFYTLKNYQLKKNEYKKPAIIIFISSLFIFSAINLSVLYMDSYPGVLTADSLTSVRQIMSGVYNNHHPYYYTKVIELCMSIGLKIFNDINAAVALYSTFQIIFMAACFSYGIMTLYQMGISLKWILICWLWYAIMPFHIMYSFTMWKDIMFGGFTIIFIVSLFRLLKNIGGYYFINYLLLLIGSIGICLFRSNGWFAFLFTVFCFKFLFEEDRGKRKLQYTFFLVLAFTFILKHPVLQYMNVKQPDFLEMIAIPGQQIARVVRDCDDIENRHLEQLDKIIDVERLPEAYTPHIFDPIKDLFWETGNYRYLTTHKLEYFMLYLEVSLSHLDTSVEAWIDMTKGYWNGGYSYWVWARNVVKNNMQIEHSVYSENMSKIVREYLWLYSNVPGLNLFLCIGFHVWLVFGIAILCIIRRDKEGLFLTIPLIAIVISLLISTPVFSEFRYIYALFCSIPFLIFAPFYNGEKETEAIKEV